MNVLDYSRSFVTFVTPQRGNNARLQIESRCRIIDTKTGTAEDYYYFASCKSERTFAERDLFQDPNYDFCGIFHREEFCIYRARAEWSEPHYADRGVWKGRFQDILWHLRDAPNPKLLPNVESIIRTTLDGVCLVGRTEIQSCDGSLRAILEFPIKTMNVNDIRTIYQVDTGPLPFPELDRKASRHIERFELAYVAYNAPHFADFVLQQATSIGKDAPKLTSHYSGIKSLKAKNEVYRVGE